MKDLKTNIFAALLLLIIVSLIYINNNDQSNDNKIVDSHSSKSNNLDFKKVKDAKKESLDKTTNKLDFKKEKQLDTIDQKKTQRNVKPQTKKEDRKVEKQALNKPIPIDQLKQNFSNNKDKFKFAKDNKINYIHNTKTDPFSKALIPQEIDKIKKDAKEFEPSPVLSDDIVTIKTNKGTMKLKLFSDVAPNHCYNFKKLANSGYYDGTTFHRIIPNFMIQGGDILSRDGSKKNDGQGGPGWTVDAEFNDVKHKRGILSMARSSDPNSAGSQFFICHADAPHLDGKYTAFGEVIENLDVIDKIVNAPTEYSETKKQCSNSIPKTEDKNDWVELLDPKTRKKLYAKVPKSMSKASFKYEMNSKLRNNNPMYDVRILSIRID
jgi:cyclophilin family peptidyl-prolyl cis-trans isomerase